MARPRLDHVRTVQIIAAAAQVLSERGYANARVADIAKAAGTSPAAVLYWFDGKDGLLAEALTLREQEFHTRFTSRLDGLPTASQLLVDAMLYEYDWGLWLELCVLAIRDENAAAARDRMDRRWRAGLRSVIRFGQGRGEFIDGDANQITFVLAGLLDGLAPLLTVRATGVTASDVESTWLAEAARLLGDRFDCRPLRNANDSTLADSAAT
jgi:AcrR family transcriptional regulator